MKTSVYFLFLILLIASCSVHKEPVFIKVDNVKIVSFASDTIKLKAAVFFENPNAVGGLISTDNINIFVNGSAVAKVFSAPFKVPGDKVFSIPLMAHIPTKNILNSDKSGVLGGLLNSLLTREVKVQIKGNLQYVVFGFKRSFVINKTQVIKIKL